MESRNGPTKNPECLDIGRPHGEDRGVDTTAPSGLEAFEFASKEDFLEQTVTVWGPDKVRFWREVGTPLVIDQREGYFIYDTSGKRLIDLHLNGGTYNLGHRNPELIEALEWATDRFDVGNHHFPALARTALAKALLATCDPGLTRVVFTAGGGEANDVAIKSARYATGRRKIVSITKAFHGSTGLAMGATDDRFSARFLCDRPDEFDQVPFNNVEAMETALRGNDVAAVIMETIPATSGFQMPEPGYLAAVKRLCEASGAMFIADEVQTGLMRTGEMWAIYGYGVEPDILVTAKGIGGGIYPIACVVLSPTCGAWLEEDGWGHVSTAGGSELGCVVAMKVLEITQRPPIRSMVRATSERFELGLREIQDRHPDWLVGIRQNGLVMGLEFDHPQGSQFVMKRLYDNGVWAIFSTLDPRVLQFKPGLLVDGALCDDVLDRLDAAVASAREDAAKR
jgi:acetylornithine/succinyldiaminopimelate/putrescine aminotransferase